MKNALKYPLLFLAIVLLSCLMLLIGGLVPQSALKAHMVESLDQLAQEGTSYGVLFSGHPRSTLDNYSEFRILIHSYYMNAAASPSAILSNPGWGPNVFDVKTLFGDARAAILADAPSNLTYTRYWMGFRAVVRPLLAVMNYMDMRQLIQWSFVLLVGAVTLRLYKKTSSFWIAMGFVFAISQLNPVAITACFQFSTCFIIALIGMLLSLSLRFRRITEPMLFFILGAATQYFDFYTTPLLTFGLPMLALLLRRQFENGTDFRFRVSLKRMLRSLVAWTSAYALLWLAKLALTAVFADPNAFTDAFGRLTSWVTYAPGQESAIGTIGQALFYTGLNLFDIVPALLEGTLIIAYLVVILRTKPSKQVWRENAIYLLVAILPVLWIIATAKPSYHHMYFQYRGLGIAMFGGILFLLNTIRPKETPAVEVSAPQKSLQ